MYQGLGYGAYLGISALMVVTVGQVLYTNGKYFLRDVFADDPELAGAVNRLLLVGFYLVNIGFVLLTSSLGADSGDGAAFGRVLTVKLGGLAVVLGVVHLINLSALNNARRRRRLESRRGYQPQPVAETHR